MEKKRALITGISGMAGSHLADLLLSENYEVFGLERRVSTKNRANIKHLEGKITFIAGDLSDQNSLLRAIRIAEPHEFYNLAAQSFVGESWNTPEQTGDITGLGVLRCLEAIRESKLNIKYYQSSSSEMFGGMGDGIANENTIFYPRSPYGVAKLYGHWITKNYRESYNMFNCSGILFNFESERRGHEFVTRKISDGVARIKLGLSDKIILGNLSAKRDWGYAVDFVRAMYLIMQQPTPDDFVIATGIVHSVEDFVSIAFAHVGIFDYEKYIVVDKRFMRPADVEYLRGDASKAKKILGWEPSVSFEEIVKIMVDNDLKLLGGN